MALSNAQLNTAVQCYLQMRAAVVAKGCTPGPFANPTLHALVGDPFINVTLVQTTQLATPDVWDLMWHLPFYTWMNKTIAKARETAARKGGWFTNFSVFVGANANPRHPWHVDKSPAYTAKGPDAKDFCAKTGNYRAMPYLTAPKVIYRINSLADFVHCLHVNASLHRRSIVDELAGGSAAAPLAVRIAFKNLSPRIGGATAFHILSDFGFPCVKPDLWMTRFADWCGWAPGYTAKRLSNSPGWWVLQDVIQQISWHAKTHFGVSDPNPIRALDWYVANYGMNFNPKSCPCTGLGVIVQPD